MPPHTGRFQTACTLSLWMQPQLSVKHFHSAMLCSRPWGYKDLIKKNIIILYLWFSQRRRAMEAHRGKMPRCDLCWMEVRGDGGVCGGGGPESLMPELGFE